MFPQGAIGGKAFSGFARYAADARAVPIFSCSVIQFSLMVVSF